MRKSAAQQSELREAMPPTTPQTSIPATSSESPEGAALDRKQQKKELNREKNRRGKERTNNESPTPAGKP
jgi:hypothetical protein